MKRLVNLALFLYRNFGPLIVFYLVNRTFGLKPAIAVSLLFSALEVIHFKISKAEVSSFFMFSMGMAFVFGGLDLYLENAFFYKIEASVTNLFTAFFFGLSLFQEKPLIQLFAEQQGRAKGEHPEDKTFFFRGLTFVWTIYFVIKAGLYLWINLNSSTEQGLVSRMIIGNVSFGVMMFFSIVTARPLWNFMIKMKWLPSSRESKNGLPAAQELV